MRTRTTILLVMALLVLGAFPASATDRQGDVCDGLLTALDVLENQSRASQRAIERLQAQAQDAGCFNAYDVSRQVCDSADGTFMVIDEGNILWECEDFAYTGNPFLDPNADALLRSCFDEEDGNRFTVTGAAPTATAECAKF